MSTISVPVPFRWYLRYSSKHSVLQVPSLQLPPSLEREPNTEVFKGMHSFNKLAIEVKGWTILRGCTTAGDEHKLSCGRIEIQMVVVHPQID